MSPILITPDQRAKALRIYSAALPLIAEAVGLDPKTLHNRVLREALFGNLPFPKPAAPHALTSAAEIDVSPRVDQPSPADSSQTGEGTLSQRGPDEEAAASDPNVSGHLETEMLASAAAPKQETSPVLQRKPATQATWDEKTSAGLVTLRDAHGNYLNMDGSGITTNRSFAYRGTVPQAKAMRKLKPIAAGMSISHFTQKP